VGRSNSAQRLRAIYGTFHVRGDIVSSFPALAGRPILLIDDRTDTGWTLTLVATLLRAAGAGPVYPFVLAVQA
jgi:ATP-dependent DNA helicase RecQ